MKKELCEMDESPYSLAKKTVKSFDSLDDNESLLIPEINSGKTTACASPLTKLPVSPSPPTESPTPLTDKTPRLILQMDVTGFRVEDLHVDVDAGKSLLCLSGMGPRMFKRAIPLPPSIRTMGDMACLEASIVVLDTDKNGGRHHLLVQSNPRQVHDSPKEEEEEDDHSSLSSSNLGKIVATNKKTTVSSSAGRRSIRIRDETRPPLQVMVPHSVAGLCA